MSSNSPFYASCLTWNCSDPQLCGCCCCPWCCPWRCNGCVSSSAYRGCSVASQLVPFAVFATDAQSFRILESRRSRPRSLPAVCFPAPEITAEWWRPPAFPEASGWRSCFDEAATKKSNVLDVNVLLHFNSDEYILYDRIYSSTSFTNWMSPLVLHKTLANFLLLHIL